MQLSVKEISLELGVNIQTVYNIIHRKRIKAVKEEFGKNYYNLSQFNTNVIEYITKYYPMKTTEVWHVYESKMNKL